MDDNLPQEQIIDAEIVKDEAVPDGENAAQTIISLTNLS